MNPRNKPEVGDGVPAVRITRARAKMLDPAAGIFQPSEPNFKQEQKHDILANAKRAALDENKPSAVGVVQHKRRAVMTDVTNLVSDNLHGNRVRAAKSQNAKQTKVGLAKKGKGVGAEENEKVPMIHENVKAKLASGLSRVEVGECIMSIDLPNWTKEEVEKDSLSPTFNNTRNFHPVESFEDPTGCILTLEQDMDCEKQRDINSSGVIIDIDSKLKDPQACITYANDIQKNARILELHRRPSTNYMETLQRDITPNMRGILIDWLVEVSEEYKLAADTLYLTINLIDRFLSQKLVEKQRLQLLGVTCMLIASKYEEICAPPVEEFCIITDNTYTKEEVLKMESQVLNLLHFHFSVPTVKPFLRRFIQAAKVSYKETSVELEFLANYLAELTLIEYSFLKFLPSLIAASSIFLARWTLNPSDHPWNPTLEHYTGYKASQLKTTVLALEDLQNNTSGCSLNAIREKYRQQKFKCVATLTPKDPVGSLFKILTAAHCLEESPQLIHPLRSVRFSA